ncbi:MULTISPECIES: ABC transporter ATP-binding protein [Haloferax]|uniref:Dipeptide ABC transporter ATP-binding protein n=2 Tax=Haloferax TaxID=2251 RepID=A0A6G1Z5A8_9EURY|nr:MULTISPECIES: ABC transporter ATP-binding protein [Haloferax]KAB1188781.1 ABC transporter ATP-binding protein [Haloferax sp. CBA1149]MRW81494.1 dipeptide ABC transporter ATP-binding protein [Haloferax marinisediminis]
MSLLEVEDLRIRYKTAKEDVHAVNGVSFSVDGGDNYGLVGESGCGKSTIAHSILGLLDDNARIESGTVRFDGQNLLDLSEKEWRDVRWQQISYIPQSAMDSLDPVMTVGKQIRQSITTHRDVSKAEAQARVDEVFEIVGLDPARTTDYPHQFSGGMRQRVTIAMALALDPDLIIADEPTTGLDVIVQDKIIHKLMEIQEEIDSSLLLITHDIGVVAETCDDVSVLYGGKVMEQGETRHVLKNPTNPYTMGLKNSFPDIDDFDSQAISIPGSLPDLTEEPTGCVFRNRCPFATEACEDGHPEIQTVENQRSACYHTDRVEHLRTEATEPETWGLEFAERGESGDVGDTVLETDDLSKWFTQTQGIIDQLRGNEPNYVKAVNEVDLDVRENEIVGIAGESGCGKSTLGEVISVLQPRTDGTISFRGTTVDEYLDGGSKEFRSKVQFIFQDPFDSLNPRQTVRAAVAEPLKIHGYDRDTIEEKVRETVSDVGLNPPHKYLDDYPHQLSGGERQRVAIARALVLDPELLICDEPASMLDVSLKASILNILRQMADERDIGIVYISHDLASLSQISDRLAVMYLGRIVELGETRELVQNPKHPYAASLLSASPNADPTEERRRVLLPGEPPNPVNLPEGCNFAPRCPKATEECWSVEPERTTYQDGDHEAACHHPVERIEHELLAKYE